MGWDVQKASRFITRSRKGHAVGEAGRGCVDEEMKSSLSEGRDEKQRKKE